MRLRTTEIDAIKEVAKLVFGENTTVMVFGSRTDDELKGGDIDLLIEPNAPLSRAEQYQRKLSFLVRLKKIIGEQKIDLLIQNDPLNNPIIREINQKGIQL